jgi:hypothetical protein
VKLDRLARVDLETSPSPCASAVVNAKINPNGKATTYLVQYGPTASYGSQTNTTALGSATANTTVYATLREPRRGRREGTPGPLPLRCRSIRRRCYAGFKALVQDKYKTGTENDHCEPPSGSPRGGWSSRFRPILTVRATGPGIGRRTGPNYLMTNHYLGIGGWCYWFIYPRMLSRERAEHRKHEPIPDLVSHNSTTRYRRSRNRPAANRVTARSPKRVAAAPSEQEADAVDRTFA